MSTSGISWNLADHPKLPKPYTATVAVLDGWIGVLGCLDVFFRDRVGKNEWLGVFLKSGGHRVLRRRRSAVVVIGGSISGRWIWRFRGNWRADHPTPFEGKTAAVVAFDRWVGTCSWYLCCVLCRSPLAELADHPRLPDGKTTAAAVVDGMPMVSKNRMPYR